MLITRHERHRPNVYFGASEQWIWIPCPTLSGEVFLLGDDRASSIDSRTFGTVPAGEVTGLVGSRLWPSPGGLPDERC